MLKVEIYAVADQMNLIWSKLHLNIVYSIQIDIPETLMVIGISEIKYK